MTSYIYPVFLRIFTEEIKAAKIAEVISLFTISDRKIIVGGTLSM